MSPLYNKQYAPLVAHGHGLFDWFFLEMEV